MTPVISPSQEHTHTNKKCQSCFILLQGLTTSLGKQAISSENVNYHELIALILSTIFFYLDMVNISITKFKILHHLYNFNWNFFWFRNIYHTHSSVKQINSLRKKTQRAYISIEKR